MTYKKGLSEMTSTMLIILITLSAALIAWSIINPLLERGSSEASLQQKCIHSNISLTSCSSTNNEIILYVRLNAGEASKIIGFVEFEDGTSSSSSTDISGRFSTSQIKINKLPSQIPEKISATAIVSEGDNQLICSNTQVECVIS